MLLTASYYFYMCWKPEFIILILFSTAIDYFCGLGIGKFRTNLWFTKGLLAVSLSTNLGLLFFFKYLNFFGETLTALCQAVSIPFTAPTLNIILPVGISFYTFQTLSYTIDVYRGKQEPERNFVCFALFVSFFPQLVAGPIETAANLLPQLKGEYRFSYDNASYGLKLMAWGFFKKLVIADRLAALFVDPVYQDPLQYSGGAFIIAAVAFAFQIYCDFGGYSDIARGCAKTMGIDLLVNFKAPYFATSLTDFWRRWHISLTNWFREYVYISLGGNQKGAWKKALFVTVIFFLSGLWHGAGWTFIIWGLLQALYLNIDSLIHCYGQHSSSHFSAPLLLLRSLVGRLWTFSLCCFSWVFFRAESIEEAFYIIRHSITGGKLPMQYIKNAILSFNPEKTVILLLLFCLFLLILFDLVNEKEDAIQKLSAWPVYIRWPIYICFLFLVLVLIPKEGSTPFIYFQF